MVILQNLLGGGREGGGEEEDLAFHMDDQEFFPAARSDGQASFVVMNFSGTEEHSITITGTGSVHNNTMSDGDRTERTKDQTEPAGGGCLVATAAFGSEMSVPIQQLRETRDRLLQTESGSSFMNA